MDKNLDIKRTEEYEHKIYKQMNLDFPEYGKKIDLMSFSYFNSLNGEDTCILNENDKKFYKVKIQYKTPCEGFIYEIIDEDIINDEGYTNMIFDGKTIKEYYPDFVGDDDKQYVVVLNKNEQNPF